MPDGIFKSLEAIALCQRNCAVLPAHFEENIETLFSHMYGDRDEQLKTIDDIQRIIDSVRKIIRPL